MSNNCRCGDVFATQTCAQTNLQASPVRPVPRFVCHIAFSVLVGRCAARQVIQHTRSGLRLCRPSERGQLLRGLAKQVVAATPFLPIAAHVLTARHVPDKRARQGNMGRAAVELAEMQKSAACRRPLRGIHGGRSRADLRLHLERSGRNFDHPIAHRIPVLADENDVAIVRSGTIKTARGVST